MKENTELISEIIFSNFPPAYIKRNHTKQLVDTLKKCALSFRGQFFNGVATVGIGTILLIAIYLFFFQLAEYGWQ